ncbi:hypothetical protein A2U01_0067470, partial [Trifolium medium]|nr:hypothetical protein [Trifolium medium]
MVPRSRFKWDLDLAGDLERESSRSMESSKVIDGITIDLNARWRIVKKEIELLVFSPQAKTRGQH